MKQFSYQKYLNAYSITKMRKGKAGQTGKGIYSFPTNEEQNQNQSHLVRAIFPALWASYS